MGVIGPGNLLHPECQWRYHCYCLGCVIPHAESGATGALTLPLFCMLSRNTRQESIPVRKSSPSCRPAQELTAMRLNA